MKQASLFSKHLILVGGGHSHVQVVRYLGMNPVPGLKVTLICKDTDTPYSGMLPGHIAGHYSFDDIHIDLMRLSAWAQIRYINASVTSIDPKGNRLTLVKGPRDEGSEMSFDILSINTGSAPDLETVPGARAHALPVKPISSFLERWDHLETQLNSELSGDHKQRIAVVGAGAGGVELILALQHRLSKAQKAGKVAFSLIGRADRVLPSQSLGLSARLHKELVAKDIALELGVGVTDVKAKELVFEDGRSLGYEALLWVTKARAGEWLKHIGLDLTEQGFLAVGDTLQSTSHSHIFAAGDCATMINQPREKAGVFAVRQGPILARNLVAFAKGQALKDHRAQSSYLSLVALGQKSAAGAKSWFNFAGPWVWWWKDRIDRAFMDKFSNLPPMGQDVPLGGIQPPAELAKPLCSGCGGKIAQTSLEAALSARGLQADPQDAAQIPGSDLVQSVDLLTLPLTDLKASAAILTAHALSDIYAEGGVPIAAQVIAGVERQAQHLEQDDLALLMAGVQAVLDQDKVALIGGHSLTSSDPLLGLSVTGRLLDGARWPKSGSQTGDLLYMTRPLGSGVLFAGLMTGDTKGRWIDALIPQLSQSNKAHGELVRQIGVHACTDITGFGLLGHAAEMARGSGKSIHLDIEKLPVFEGAFTTLQQGVRSSLHVENAKLVSLNEADPRQVILADPQTSGGLLVSVAANKALDFENLAQTHQLPLWHIGQVQDLYTSGEFLSISG